MRHEQTVYRCMVSGARRLQAAMQYGGGVAVLVGVLMLPLLAAGQEPAAALAVPNSDEAVEAVATGAPRAGDLDTSFGGTGTVLTGFSRSVDDWARAYAVVIQPDGKMVVAGTTGQFALARYTITGTLDPSFGGDGKVTTSLHGSAEVRGVAIQADGKIVVAGSVGASAFVLARYTTTGSLDLTFGPTHTGMVTTDFGGYGEARGVAIQADGKIVVAGSGFGSGTFDFALARYTTTGSLDPTFGPAHTGMVTTDFDGDADFVTAMAIQPNGKIVVVGRADNSVNGTSDFALARYTTTGSLDPTFGPAHTGMVTTDFNGAVGAVAIQADGKIVVVGWPNDLTRGVHSVLARYTTTGSLDPTFGTAGIVHACFGPNCEASPFAYAVALQVDGKIVVAGGADPTGRSSDFFLARYNTNGTLDTSFSGDGTVLTDFGSGGWAWAFALAIQPYDGRLVVAGSSPNLASGSDDFALARYHAHTCGGGVVTQINAKSHTTVLGTSGNDVIFDFGHDDRIYGLGGNDNICASRGTNVLSGGSGNDYLRGGSGTDTLDGGTGTDRCDGGAGSGDRAIACEHVQNVP